MRIAYFKFIFFILIFVSILGCSQNTSVNAEKFTEQATLQSVNISGVYELNSGYVNIGGYNSGMAYGLISNIPLEKPENSNGLLFLSNAVKVNTTGYNNSFFALSKASSNDDYAEFGDEVSEPELVDNFSRIRQQETDLLNNTAVGADFISNARGRFANYAARPSRTFELGGIWQNINVGFSVTRKVNAKCVFISKYAYFFNEIGVAQVSQAMLQEYAEGFDKLYDELGDNFSYPNDTDENGKIIILFSDFKDDGAILGYFSPIDKYLPYNCPISGCEYSNEADIFYINTQEAVYADKVNSTLSTIAHEFQHMMLFDKRYNNMLEGVTHSYPSDIWLNEGLSMLASFVAGYYTDGSDPYLKNFFRGQYYYGAATSGKPVGLSLTGWTSLNYGYSALFARYIYDRFGENIIKKIYSSPYSGIRAVELATGQDFNVLFRDFTIALVVSGKGITSDERFNFKTIDISSYVSKMSPTLSYEGLVPYQVYDGGKGGVVSLKPYGFCYLGWRGVISELDAIGANGFVVPEKALK